MTRSKDLFIYHHSKVHPGDEPSLLRWYASIDQESRREIFRSSAQTMNAWMRMKDFHPNDLIDLQYSALFFSIDLERNKEKSSHKKSSSSNEKPDGKVLNPKSVASGEKKRKKSPLKSKIDHRLMKELHAYRNSEDPKIGFRRMSKYVKNSIGKDISHVYLQKIYVEKFGKD